MDSLQGGNSAFLGLQDNDAQAASDGDYPAKAKPRADEVVGPAIAAVPTIPDYLHDTYFWAYLSERGQRILDRQFIVTSILWGNATRLTQAVTSELEPGQKVLQPAGVYGTFCQDLARRVGPEGRLDVIDIVPSQVAISQRKLETFDHANARVADAAKPGAKGYDAVACYFLLHEVPESYKRDIVSALLDCVRAGGKVVFVDYHRPGLFHPLRPLMSLVLDTLEPYAKSLWTNEIESFAPAGNDFEWSKEVLFGGLYQKVVARHKGGA